MIIAVASNNIPKVSACKKVINNLKNELSSDENIEIINRKIESDVGAMPLSLDDLMNGAKNRAKKIFKLLKEENRFPTYSIGMEGGFFLKYSPCRNSPVAFLQSWSYVYDGEKGYWGSSGAIEVPQNIFSKISDTGKELSEIIDDIADVENVRSKQGTVGVLTNNRITRQDFFESALLFAFAPFFNSEMYSYENKI